MPHPISARAPVRRRTAVLAASVSLLAALIAFAAAAQAATETPTDTFAISLTADGNYADDGVGQRISISDDGRRVAFISTSGSFDADFAGGMPQAYAKDLDTGQVVLASRADGGGGVPADEPRPEGQVGVDRPLISGDGRYLVFETPADNLVPGLPPGEEFPRHVYRRDLETGETVLVDRVTGAAGAILEREARADSVSDDGRYVVFSAPVADLEDPAGDHDEGVETVYIRDLQAGTTTAVSRASDEGGAPGDLADAASSEGQISGDGRYVAFASAATNLAPGTTGASEIYRRDLQTGATVLVSRTAPTESAPDGLPADGESFEPLFVGDDGCRVAFSGFETSNLAPGEAPVLGAYLRDLCATPPTMTLIGRDGAGQPFEESVPAGASGDGHGVLIEATPPGPRHLYLRDLGSGQTTLLDRASGPAGAPADAEVEWAALAASGCRAVFTTQATNLTPEPPPSPEGAPHPPTQAFARQLAPCEPPLEGDTGGSGGPGGDGAAGSVGSHDANGSLELRIARLGRRGIWLDFPRRGRATVRIERGTGKRPQRRWLRVRTIVVRAKGAEEIEVPLRRLAPGRYRLTVQLDSPHSRELVRFLTVRSNTLGGPRRPDGGRLD
jgi:hypothetical protein